MFKKKSLDVLFASPVSDEMIKFLTDHALKVIPQGPQNKRHSRNAHPSPPGTPKPKDHNGVPSVMSFISKLVRYTNVYTSTLLTTVVYLNRLRAILPKDAAGLPTTCHRIFLACLILSAKFHNDSSPLNKHWTKYTDGMFTLRDVNLMERQLIQLFQWDLRVDSEDLWEDLFPLLSPIVRDLEKGAQVNRMRLAQSHAPQRLPKSTEYYHQRNLSACSSTATLLGSSRSGSVNSLDVLREYESDASTPTSSPVQKQHYKYPYPAVKYSLDPRYSSYCPI